MKTFASSILLSLLLLLPLPVLGQPDLLSPGDMTQVMDGPTFDDSTIHINLGHSFSYYGGTFTDTWMSSNGFLMFYDPTTGVGNNSYNNSRCCNGLDLANRANIGSYSYMIAPLWTDLIDKTIGANSGYFYETSDQGSSFLWYNLHEYYNNNTNTFQLNLHTDNSFDFIYDEVDITNHSVFVGFTGDVTQDKDELNQLAFATAQADFDEFDIDFHDETVPGGRAWYGNDGGYSSGPDCSNPLNDSSCTGYAAAYFAQQCTNDPLYDSGCDGYDDAVFDQDCINDQQFSEFCPGYVDDSFFDDEWLPDTGQDDGQITGMEDSDPFSSGSDDGMDDGSSFEDSFGVSEEEFYGYNTETEDQFGGNAEEDFGATGSVSSYGETSEVFQESGMDEENFDFQAAPNFESTEDDFQEVGTYSVVMIRPDELPDTSEPVNEEMSTANEPIVEEPFFEEQFEEIQDFERSLEEQFDEERALEEEELELDREIDEISPEEVDEELTEDLEPVEAIAKAPKETRKGGNRSAVALSLSTTSKLISNLEQKSSNSASTSGGNGNTGTGSSQNDGNVSNNRQNGGNVQDMKQNSGQSNQNQQQNSGGSSGSQNNGSNQFADGSNNGSSTFQASETGNIGTQDYTSAAIFGSDAQMYTAITGESGGDTGEGNSSTQISMNIEQVTQNVALGDSAPIGFAIIEPVTDMLMNEVVQEKSLAERMAKANREAKKEKSNPAAIGQTAALEIIATGVDLTSYYNNAITEREMVYLQEQVYTGKTLSDNNRTIYDLTKENHGTLQQLIRSQY
jgi:hypothetical protein